MTSRSENLNGGAYSRTAPVTGNHTATAGGSGDNTQVDGAWISRFIDEPHMGLWQSAKLVLPFTAVLNFAESFTFLVQFQDADAISGAGAANYRDPVTWTPATGDSGGSTEIDTAELDVDFEGAREFVRARITPNLSRANTDTLAWSAMYVIFGLHQSIVTKSPTAVGTP